MSLAKHFSFLKGLKSRAFIVLIYLLTMEIKSYPFASCDVFLLNAQTDPGIYTLFFVDRIE